MKQAEIAATFRKQELQRRIQRMAALTKNHLELMNEKLTPEEQTINAVAIKQLKEEWMHLERMIRPGYWQRLWAAIRSV